MIPAAYWAGTTLARICFTTFARWEVDGREAVPPRGGLIVVSNHLSNADSPMLVASIPRRLHFMAKRGLFANPLGWAFLTSVGVHPLDRNEAGIDALRWNLELLRRDCPVVLFPEGTRSRGGGMNRGKPGVAYIAAKSRASILPVGIVGTERIRGFWRIAFPLCNIRVRIGEPFTLPEIEGRLTRPLLQHMTDIIMSRVADLLPEDYKGYYATPKAESVR